MLPRWREELAEFELFAEKAAKKSRGDPGDPRIAAAQPKPSRADRDAQDHE